MPRTLRLAVTEPDGYSLLTKTTLAFPGHEVAQVESFSRFPDIVTAMIQGDIQRAIDGAVANGLRLADDPSVPLVYTLGKIFAHEGTPVGASVDVSIWYRMRAGLSQA